MGSRLSDMGDQRQRERVVPIHLKPMVTTRLYALLRNATGYRYAAVDDEVFDLTPLKDLWIYWVVSLGEALWSQMNCGSRPARPLNTLCSQKATGGGRHMGRSIVRAVCPNPESLSRLLWRSQTATIAKTNRDDSRGVWLHDVGKTEIARGVLIRMPLSAPRDDRLPHRCKRLVCPTDEVRNLTIANFD